MIDFKIYLNKYISSLQKDEDFIKLLIKNVDKQLLKEMKEYDSREK